jgi:hypothetical protein
MRRIPDLRPITIFAALVVFSPLAHAAEQDRPAEPAPPRSEARPTRDCEASLRAFRQSLLRSERELDATNSEPRRRAILTAALGRNDLAAVVRCLADASAGRSTVKE